MDAYIIILFSMKSHGFNHESRTESCMAKDIEIVSVEMTRYQELQYKIFEKI